MPTKLIDTHGEIFHWLVTLIAIAPVLQVWSGAGRLHMHSHMVQSAALRHIHEPAWVWHPRVGRGVLRLLSVGLRLSHRQPYGSGW